MFRSTFLVLLLTSFGLAQDKPDSKVTPPRIAHGGSGTFEYSEEARLHRITGTVKLKFTVDIEGPAKDIRVTQSVGYGLDENAVKGVQASQFEPATKDGKPIEWTATMDCEFRGD